MLSVVLVVGVVFVVCVCEVGAVVVGGGVTVVCGGIGMDSVVVVGDGVIVIGGDGGSGVRVDMVIAQFVWHGVDIVLVCHRWWRFRCWRQRRDCQASSSIVGGGMLVPAVGVPCCCCCWWWWWCCVVVVAVVVGMGVGVVCCWCDVDVMQVCC